MFAEVIDSLTLWRFRELVAIRIGSIESSMDKNEIVGVFTSLAIEDFDFILGSIGRQLSNTERQDFVSILFDTIAEVADAAASENIDLSTIQTHNSVTLPIRTQEVDTISRWFAQRAHSVEEYFLFISHAYHVYAATYYSIILIPHFKHALRVPISTKELYFTTVSDNIRKLILKYHYQKILSNPQDAEVIRNLFTSYSQLMFVKLLYVLCLRTKTEDDNECQNYFQYIREIGNKLTHKYGTT